MFASPRTTLFKRQYSIIQVLSRLTTRESKELIVYNSSMRYQGKKQTDKSYHPPETIKLDYCAIVLAVVMKNHPLARELHENIGSCLL
jgi:hypothetical protein